MEVIPAVNCDARECVGRRLAQAKGFGAGWAHIDISDGDFAPTATENDPDAYREASAGLQLEVHLMVRRPDEYVTRWAGAGLPVRRVIVHAAAVQAAAVESWRSRFSGIEFVIALTIGENAAVLSLFVPGLKRVLVLAVPPGESGQRFDPRAAALIASVRQAYPDMHIAVDGGINEETAREAKGAGAASVVSMSHIMESENPRAAFEALRAL